MACKQPCFDCPFIRFADKSILKDIDLVDYSINHFTEDGGFKEIYCEEQGDICFGQIQVLANGRHHGLSYLTNLGSAVNETKPNVKDYFKGIWEVLQYYEF